MSAVKMMSTHQLCARMDLYWDGKHCQLPQPLFGEVKDALRVVGMVALAGSVSQTELYAKRYRWLRTQNAYRGGVLWVVDSSEENFVGDDLDAAIDAAMIQRAAP